MKLVGVVDRLDDGDVMVRPFESFDPIAKGELIGTRADGTRVEAEQDGFIVFPNPDAEVFAEWFYFAVKSERVLTADGDA